ncbi:hypothetical protein A9X05_20355 [Mycobacterium sp. E3298]|nr:hypothetical protein A9X05_20355 [Mycobacterium sp. E3298]
MRTPSASSVSAPPASDDDARLPCLTTGTPAAATTIAAMVDKLKVLAPSPPVPTMSTAPEAMSRTPAGSGRAWLSMTSASSLTSAEVGTFIFIATAKAATWAGLASPDMIWAMAQAAWPRGRSWRSVNRPRIRGHDGAVPAAPAAEPPRDEASDDRATRRWSHEDRTSPNRRIRPPAPAVVATRKHQMPPRVEFNNYKASYLRM